MASIPPLRIPCPACGQHVDIPVTAQLGNRHGQHVALTLTADDTPIRNHIAQHPSNPERHTMPVRAKFLCNSVEQSSNEPTQVLRYLPNGGTEPTGEMRWPRTYRFMAQYDTSVPEDQRYAKATPSGSLTIAVDNPAVTFEPGKSYYLDFTPAD